MRGADSFHHRRRFGRRRFIPTCVGQMDTDTDGVVRYGGSSPHAWGRLQEVQGVLPAGTVHPHMRGADFMRAIVDFQYARFIPTCVGQIPAVVDTYRLHSGSSPHAWGRCRPARGSAGQAAVHPHMRGADVRVFASRSRSISTSGSSPHAWGRCFASFKSVCADAVHPHMRGADQQHPRPGPAYSPVHPHMRGADNAISICRHYCDGSSPHAWGRFLCGIGSIQPSDGSSPHAWGRFSVLPDTETLWPVHPHMRGADARIDEYHIEGKRFIPTCVGQIPKFDFLHFRYLRFIPTCVGQIAAQI